MNPATNRKSGEHLAMETTEARNMRLALSITSALGQLQRIHEHAINWSCQRLRSELDAVIHTLGGRT